MAFVWETVGLVTLRDRLHVGLLPALSLVGIQNLNRDRERATSKQICAKINISEAEQRFTESEYFDIRKSSLNANV